MKISKGRLKQIIQEEMSRVDESGFPDLTGDGEVTQADILKGRGVEMDEQVTPDNIMLAIEAIGQVLSTPGVKEAALGGVLAIAMQYLQKYADKDAEVMAQRPEIAPEEM